MPATPDDLFARLNALGIAHRTWRHPPLHTVEESRRLRGEIPGRHCKSLFCKDKKGTLWLLVCAEDRVLDMAEVARRIGAARLSFARAELLQQILGVSPGAVTPFALINPSARAVRVVLDRPLLAEAQVNFHPLDNTATTQIAAADLPRFVAACGHDALIVDLAGPAPVRAAGALGEPGSPSHL